MNGNEIYTVTLYYNGLIKNTTMDLPYLITTSVDTAIDVANGKLAEPTIYGDVKATAVALTIWNGTETRDYTHKTVEVEDYAKWNVTFGQNKYGVCVNIPAK